MSTWPAYQQLLVQVRRETQGYRMMVRITWLLAAGALLVLGVTQYVGRPAIGKSLLALFIWGLAQIWCGAFLKSAIMQNRPEYAALVPHLRVRLMRLVAALFISCALLLGLLAALLLDYPGYAALCGGLMAVYILFTSRYSMLAVAPSFIILMLLQTGMLNKIGLALDQGLGQALTTAIGGLLLLALGACGVYLVFPQSGDVHWAWFKRYNHRMASIRAPMQNLPNSRVGDWWQALWRSTYLAALRKDSQAGGKPERMMVHALGPGAHPVGYIRFALLSTLVVLALLAMIGVEQRATPQYMLLGTILEWSVLMAVQMYINGATDGALRYHTEQAVFLLSAGAPAVARVNRLLGGALLRGFLQVWLATLLCVFAIDSFILGHAGLRGVNFVLWMLLLPMSCLLTRNYALIGATGRELESLALTVPFLVLCIALLVLAHMLPGIPWFWLGGAVAVVTGLVLRLRWNKLMAQPPVLPAGRLVV